MQHAHQRPSAGQSARTAFWSDGRARSERPERDAAAAGRDRPAAAWDFSRGPVWPQLKLAVGRTDDPLERAADSVADQVMREPGADSARGRAPAGRGSSAPAAVAGAAPALIEDVLRAPGQALDAVTRGFMEARFGYDFSRIRVHADPAAAESAQSVRAAAYTVGQDVVFGAGQYAPGREAGRRLLAHELAHTIQPRAPGPPLIRRQPADEGPALTVDRDQPILIQHGLPAETPEASVQRKLDEFRDRMKATYHVGPDTASVAPPFGMGEGYPSQKAMAKDPDNIRHLRNIEKKPGIAGVIGRVRYARGNPDEIHAVTQALIDDGALPAGGSLEQRIVTMMFNFRVGTDCAGYVQQAYLATRGTGRQAAGLKPKIGDEDLGNIEHQGFAKVDPAAAAPGDLVVMDSLEMRQPGHTIIVYSQRPATGIDKTELTDKLTAHPPGHNDYSHLLTGHLYRFELDASWGSSGIPEQGGIQRRTFWYNPAGAADGTALWAWPRDNPEVLHLGPNPYDHRLKGFYRRRAGR